MTTPTTSTRLASIEKKLDLLIKATGTHEKERADGTKTIKSRLIKLDWKLFGTLISYTGGIIILVQIVGPAIQAFCAELVKQVMGYR